MNGQIRVELVEAQVMRKTWVEIFEGVGTTQAHCCGRVLMNEDAAEELARRINQKRAHDPGVAYATTAWSDGPEMKPGPQVGDGTSIFEQMGGTITNPEMKPGPDTTQQAHTPAE